MTSGQITKVSVSDIAVHKSELDSADRIQFKNDTIFSVTNSHVITDVTVKGDSLFEHIVAKDTIFSALRGDILKKFKGYYFTNRQTSKNNWYVIKLTKTKRGLTLGTVSSTEDLNKLRELTETTSDTIYNFNPTRQQFKKFVKTKGFTSEDFYVKVE